MVRTFNSGDDYRRPFLDEGEAACEAESKTESRAPQHENDMHYSCCRAIPIPHKERSDVTISREHGRINQRACLSHTISKFLKIKSLTAILQPCLHPKLIVLAKGLENHVRH